MEFLQLAAAEAVTHAGQQSWDNQVDVVVAVATPLLVATG
jgi:hypothetical protein